MGAKCIVCVITGESRENNWPDNYFKPTEDSGANYFNSIKVRKVAKVRNRFNQVPQLTQDTTWARDKNTIKHHKQEPRGQSFSSR